MPRHFKTRRVHTGMCRRGAISTTCQVPLQGPSYSSGVGDPNKKHNLTLFLSELSATDSTTFVTTFDTHNTTVWREYRAWLEAARRVRPLLAQDFYPLTEWSIDEDGWLAYQWCAWDSEMMGGDDVAEEETLLQHGQLGVSCAVQAFRRWGSSEASNTFRLYGLQPTTNYIVSDWLAPRPAEAQAEDEVVRTGASLMEEGFEVLIGERPGAAMLLLTRAAAPRQQ
jgi:hypothetical protein